MDQTTWILLRGLTRESGHWGQFLTRFGQATPNRQVTALDLPGNGELNQLRSPLQVSDMVANCRAQLLARGVAPPYALLAMSLGAMVALDWAQAQPVEVAAQVLINTSMRPIHAFYQRLQPANYGTLLTLMLPGTSAETWEQAILRMTSHHAPAGTLAHWLALRQAHPVSRSNALRQLIAAARFCAPPAPPPCPTLLLASVADRLVSVACSSALAQSWQCALRLHPSAGHDLPLDDAPWVIEQIRHWLAAGPETQPGTLIFHGSSASATRR